jgi:hypothetical protein
MKQIACVSTTVMITILMLIIPLAYAYDNSTYNFSITPPSGWSTKESVQGVIVQFVGPADPDTGAVNINVNVVETDLTLEGVVSETKQDWSTTLADYSLISEGSSNINGRNGYELEVSFQSNGDTIKQDTVLFVENGQMFQVSYVAGPTTYDTYSNTYAESLQTFQIKSPLLSFSFEITGIPFLLLVIAIIVIVLVAVVALSRRKRKSKSTQSFPPPPPP